ncbi:(4Fe-4S)-binding protein [bacterium]|nr:(4Fe-4S)-binding protein [bacterium]
MLTKNDVKAYAKKCGADLVGIGSMDRFEGAPKWADPRYVFPEAKAIIGLGFRIPRGYLRGIEEGTNFFQYPSMGYANINENYAPMVLREVACFLEDHGYEACVWRNTGARGPVSDMDGTSGVTASPEEASTRRRLVHFESVSPDRPAPDIFLHFRIAAYICGMGEIGYSKVFLTPEFGPRQRFAFILTDAPLEPDPIYDGPELCDKCMLCVKNCPGKAINGKETVKVKIACREIEWNKLDEWQCFYAYMGGVKEINPFLPADAYKDLPDGEKIMKGEKKLSPEEVAKVQEIVRKYAPNASDYNNAMCGGRGCIRACMIHLEQQDKLKNKFKEPFRKRKPWRL